VNPAAQDDHHDETDVRGRDKHGGTRRAPSYNDGLHTDRSF
jgi:hypothetical protein